MNKSEKKPKITRRQQQKEETRNIIRDAAYSLFEEKGYEATTMRELASRAGVGLGTIFKHFPAKTSLLVVTFEEDVGTIVDRAFNTMPNLDIIAQMTHFAKCLYEFYARRPLLSRVLCMEVFFMSAKQGESIEVHIRSLLERFCALIENAIKNGELHRETDPNVAALAFWSFYSIGLLICLRNDFTNIDEQVVMIRQLLEQHFHFVPKN